MNKKIEFNPQDYLQDIQKTLAKDKTLKRAKQLSYVVSRLSTNSPLREKLAEIFNTGCYDEIQNITLDLNQYDNCLYTAFAVDFQVASLFKKYKFPSKVYTMQSRRTAAIQKFLDTEVRMCDVNSRIYRLTTFIGSARPGTGYDHYLEIFSDIKTIIGNILGEAPMLSDLHCHHGSGSTSSLKKDEAVLENKVREYPLSVNDRSAYEAVCDFYQMKPDLDDGSFIIHPSRLSTVPKSTKIDRVICMEPTMAVFLQLGLGTYLKERLKLVGIDLYDQGPNQRLAQKAYSENLCTIDLESASDSISRAVVECFLPPEWIKLLDVPRSRTYSLVVNEVELKELELQLLNPNITIVSTRYIKKDDKVLYELIIKFNKWSSMGNGYTFELETILFYAITTAISKYFRAKGPILVYGDDIICHRTLAPALTDLLSDLGFLLNQQKTHVSGNYFESCGKHYFRGYDVTPVTIKENFKSLDCVITTHNLLHDWYRDIYQDVLCTRYGAASIFGRPIYWYSFDDVSTVLRYGLPTNLVIPWHYQGSNGFKTDSFDAVEGDISPLYNVVSVAKSMHSECEGVYYLVGLSMANFRDKDRDSMDFQRQQTIYGNRQYDRLGNIRTSFRRGQSLERFKKFLFLNYENIPEPSEQIYSYNKKLDTYKLVSNERVYIYTTQRVKRYCHVAYMSSFTGPNVS